MKWKKKLSLNKKNEHCFKFSKLKNSTINHKFRIRFFPSRDFFPSICMSYMNMVKIFAFLITCVFMVWYVHFYSDENPTFESEFQFLVFQTQIFQSRFGRNSVIYDIFSLACENDIHFFSLLLWNVFNFHVTACWINHS